MLERPLPAGVSLVSRMCRSIAWGRRGQGAVFVSGGGLADRLRHWLSSTAVSTGPLAAAGGGRSVRAAGRWAAQRGGQGGGVAARGRQR